MLDDGLGLIDETINRTFDSSDQYFGILAASSLGIVGEMSIGIISGE
jgi:hypothetical protein